MSDSAFGPVAGIVPVPPRPAWVDDVDYYGGEVPLESEDELIAVLVHDNGLTSFVVLAEDGGALVVPSVRFDPKWVGR